MFRTLIRYNDPDLVDKLVSELTPMFRTWVMHEAERIGRMPLLDPAEKAALLHAIQKKVGPVDQRFGRTVDQRFRRVDSRIGRVDPTTADITKRLILLLILTEAERERQRDQPGDTGIASPDLAREIEAEQNAIHTIARMHEQLYDAALEILENIKS